MAYKLWQAMPRMDITAAVDVLLVAFLVYQFFAIVRGRRAERILFGIVLVVLVYSASIYFGLELLRSIIGNAVPYTAFALIVVFQSEIRRLLARLGKARMFSFGSRLQNREGLDEILLALDVLQKNRVGALLVLERDIGLRTFVESGVQLDALVSRDLILAIFQFGGALHDGAAIIHRDRLAAASCFLPLSMNPNVSRSLGTRHRAALGVTEETDSLAIVVSEETGKMSVAAFGELYTDLTLGDVEARVLQHMTRRTPSQRPADQSGTQQIVLPVTETAVAKQDGGAARMDASRMDTRVMESRPMESRPMEQGRMESKS
ncbi:MAG: diadenylate cyclase CdaA [Bryobacterales bacterium]|nr:diadenylate cyclase CdaA [Bryobacterales bacterium]